MFELPDLPYSHDALAPHMSAETLEFHHGKHHKAYVDKANDLIDHTDLKGKSLEEIVQATHGQNAALFNNAAQHYNHLHFWRWMKPNGGGSIPSELEDRIKLDFGSVAEFKLAFVKAGTGQFGSGWCWLEFYEGKLRVAATANAENPLVYGGVPILVRVPVNKRNVLGGDFDVSRTGFGQSPRKQAAAPEAPRVVSFQAFVRFQRQIKGLGRRRIEQTVRIV